jgi:hypothetical protein
VDDEQDNHTGSNRDRAAARRDVDAGIRDRLADDEMPDGERDARAHAARDRMAAMRDRQAAAREREQAEQAQAERRRSQGATDDA